MSAPGVTLPSATAGSGFIGSDALVRILAGIGILLVWEVIVRLWAPLFVARPSRIIAVFPDVITTPAFWQAAGSTLGAVFQGLAIAFVFGTAIGIAVGRIRVVDRMLQLYISGLFALPMVAILPLFSLWFGYTADARLATVIFAAFFSIVLNVADGARSVPPEYIEVSRAYRGGAWSRLFDVILPTSVPYILAGLRLAAGRALIGAVVAEYFTTIGGLGYFILFQTRTFHHNEAFVAVAVLALAGVLFEFALMGATSRFLPWYRRDERGG
jgi:ABC-type nitrate/sulfonate/bicarbonate transport system permease component